MRATKPTTLEVRQIDLTGSTAVSGVGAAAGFAYQHAQAVHRVLDLAEDPTLGFVRVEATNDVIDVETYTADQRLWSASQFKRRDRAYTWGKAELMTETRAMVGVG